MSPKWITYSHTYLTIQANVFLSILKRAPLIGSLLPADLYKRRLPKYVASGFGMVLDLVKKGLGGNIAVFLLVHQVPNWLSQTSDKLVWPNDNISILLFLLLACLAPAALGSKIFKTSPEDYTFLNHFMVEPRGYYRYKAAKDFVFSGLLLAPVLIYLFRNVTVVMFLLTSKICALGLAHVFFLASYKKRRRIPKVKKRLLLNLGLHLVTYTLIILGAFNKVEIAPAVLQFLSVLQLVALVFCLRYLARFDEYKAIAVQYANKDTLSLQVRRVTPLDEDARGLEISNWTDNKEFFSANEGRDVWSFMDTALRTRYRKFIRTSYRDKMINNMIFGLLLGFLIRFGILNIDSQNLLMYSPKVIPFAIGMTFGGWYLPMCFRHMDLPLISHHLYQESTIRKSMVCRYIFLLKNGAALVASLIFGLLLTLWLGGLQIGASDFLQLSLAYSLIYLIYETYHVIVYYLLQPYTDDLTVQNPVFSVLNWLTGIFAIAVLFAKNNVILLLPALTIALGIVWLLFLLTLQLSPKTFRLRFVEDAGRTLNQL